MLIFLKSIFKVVALCLFPTGLLPGLHPERAGRQLVYNILQHV